MNTPTSPLLTSFQAALLREGLAPSTREKYTQHVAEFVGAMGDDDERTLAATRADAEAYIDRLLVAQGLSVATVRLRIAALRRFYDHLEGPGERKPSRVLGTWLSASRSR